MIEKIKYKNDLIAMIIRSKNINQKRHQFFYERKGAIQVAYMNHKRPHNCLIVI